MNPVQIEGMTRNLGKPLNWDEEKHGPCRSLSIRDELTPEGNRFMVSEWKPTPDELEKLNKDGTIQLGINGVSHPVIFLFVP